METDALVGSVPRITNQLTENVLRELELDEEDAVSLLFLLNFTKNNALDECERMFAQYKSCQKFNWFNYVSNFENWEHIVFEALLLMQNFEVLKNQMKLSNAEINQLTDYRLVPTKYINEIARSFYLLCESLNKRNERELLKKVYSTVEAKRFYYMEFHVLYWFKVKFVTLCDNDAGNFNKLLSILKAMDLYDSPDYRNLQDLNVKDRGTNDGDQNDIFLGTSSPNVVAPIRKNFLAIIINEENYINPDLNRTGSQRDVDELCFTFKGLGFHVETYEDLIARDFRKTLREIPNKYGGIYDVIVLIILSHGEEGVLKLIDEDCIDFEYIKSSLCCTQLKDTIKIVIAQCCQSKDVGTTGDYEVQLDGIPGRSHTKSIDNYKLYYFWKSTLTRFAAVRDPARGTWFVQILCEVLQSNDPNRSIYDVNMAVNKRLDQKVAWIDGKRVKQLSELTLSPVENFIFPVFNKELADSLRKS